MLRPPKRERTRVARSPPYNPCVRKINEHEQPTTPTLASIETAVTPSIQASSVDVVSSLNSLAVPASGSTNTIELLDVIPANPNPFWVYKREHLPNSLIKSGNMNAWNEFVKCVKVTPREPILISGPSGSGKTFGVHTCTTGVLGMNKYEVTPTTVSGIDLMESQIGSVRKARTLLGPRICVIDDIEGFDVTYIRKLVNIVRTSQANVGPLVIICIDPFELVFKELREACNVHIRIRRPNIEQIITVGKLALPKHPKSIIERNAAHANGNLHQLFVRLNTVVNSAPDAEVSRFETSRELLCGQSDVETWIRSAEPWQLISIMFNNYSMLHNLQYHQQSLDELEFLAEYIDGVSFTDIMPVDHALQSVGLATQQHFRLKKKLIPALPFMKQLPKRNDYQYDIPTCLLPVKPTHQPWSTF